MSIMCWMFIPAYMPHVQDGSGTWCCCFSQNSRVASEDAASIERMSPLRLHVASHACLGVHRTPLRDVTPSSFQFQARYAVKGSMYVSGTFAKSTPYLA